MVTRARDSATRRDDMVVRQLAARDITDPRVLQAFRDVPREAFVPKSLAHEAYEDRPLPIGQHQTISQPYIVALTLQALNLTGSERVLEIGTGSGYSAALLSRLAREVYSVERLPSMAESARGRLASLGYRVHVKVGDGTLGWPEQAPYEAIAVAAGGPRVPEALVAQLASGGRLVIPVGGDEGQVLLRVLQIPGDGLQHEPIEHVRFVPLIGVQGQPERTASRA
ncbi:MAG TPA: protein-L-isoaspartate(D-aspartate) O-methyltransferase [Polyangiaceae bacterium]|nr:protein-L-isoaspartate(D-aspartate) O-methyltransferase [Polyangiaceae bacterium]